MPEPAAPTTAVARPAKRLSASRERTILRAVYEILAESGYQGLDYHRLNLAGMEEHARLAEQLRGAPSYFPSGALQWADAANQQRLADNVERLQALGYLAHWVTPDEAARPAGGLRIPAIIASIATSPARDMVCRTVSTKVTRSTSSM